MSADVMVATVTGEVPADALGLTLTHEHLANDVSAAVGPPSDPAFAYLREATVTPTLAWALRDEPYACADHCRIDDPDAVLADLRSFARAGGRTVVDVTPSGLGRDPLGLVELSRASGVQVVMGSGWYIEKFESAETRAAGEDELVEALLTEFRHGADDSGVRPGVIGEIAVSPEFTPGERRRLRAAARVQRETGVPLYVHLPGWQRRAFEVFDIVLDDVGVDPSAVVLCHMDPSGDDPDYRRAVAERGMWLEFDMIGMPFRYPGEGQSPPADATADAVAALVDAGHTNVLLSHDLFLKTMLTAYGGNGLCFVPLLFTRRLRERGVPDELVDQFVSVNPGRLFAGAAG